MCKRIKKIVKDKTIHYIWSDNVLLHEVFKTNDNEQVITWVYEQGSFVPTAKLVDNESFSIVSDYIGRPVLAFDENGEKVWSAEYDIYGKLTNLQGDKAFIPFRQLGQYEDVETGLYYNRFRYYDPNSGLYISQDPIGLAGNNPNLYGYVFDSNTEVDIFGLVKTATKILQKKWLEYVGFRHLNSDIHHGFPEEFADRFRKIADIDVNDPKYYYNLPKHKHTKKPGIHTNSSRSGKNWNKVWEGILNQTEKMNLSQKEAKIFLESRLRELARKERISKYNSEAIKKGKHH